MQFLSNPPITGDVTNMPEELEELSEELQHPTSSHLPRRFGGYISSVPDPIQVPISSTAVKEGEYNAFDHDIPMAAPTHSIGTTFTPVT